MDIRYAVRVFAFKDNKVACIKYKNILFTCDENHNIINMEVKE